MVREVYGSKFLHTLWPVTYCKKARVNLFLTFELWQGTKFNSDSKNNILLKTANGKILLDLRIKTHDDWMAGVNLLSKRIVKEACARKKECLLV